MKPFSALLATTTFTTGNGYHDATSEGVWKSGEMAVQVMITRQPRNAVQQNETIQHNNMEVNRHE